MGGLKEFRIYFDNPLATYYGGQVVSGRLSVKLDKEKTLRGLEVKFRGRAEVQWKESRQVRDSKGKSHTRWETYSAQESYFETKHYLIGSQHGDMALPIGDHVFPFSMTLPNNLPSSFEGEDGNIRYTVKATMDRPWKFDHEAKAAFTVLSQLDLNTESGIKEPRQMQRDKYLCCCCCKSGPITVVATVPVTGYVPGQDISISVELDNTTDETVSNVICSLKKNVRFHASHGYSHKTHNYSTKVAGIESMEGVGPHGNGNWSLKLKVPSLPPSYLKFCNIIDIDYELKVKCILDGFHSNMSGSIPIVVGTIPLMSFFPNLTPATAPAAIPAGDDLPPSFNDVYGGGEPGVGWSVNPAPGFPSPGGQPYPIPGGSPYPPKKDLSGPYPPGGSAPYPPPTGGTAPYPPAAGLPYPPSPRHSGVPGEAPYPAPPGGSSPYPTKRDPADPYAPPSVPSPYPPAAVHRPQPPAGGSGPFAPSAPFDPNPPYPEMPPPSYEESVLGRKDIKESDDSDHTHGEMGFAPRYPMYHFNQ